MTTGERIEKLAKEKGVNLHQLSQLAGISYNTLYSMVRRKSNNVDHEIAGKIASALGVSLYEFFGWGETDSIASIDQMIAETQHFRKDVRYTRAIEFANTTAGQLILIDFQYLNEQGKQEAAKRISELCCIPQYRLDYYKESPSTPNEDATEAPTNPEYSPSPPPAATNVGGGD